MLFAYKDYDFIMSLPIKKEHHLFSRSSSVCCRGYLVYCRPAASLLAYFTFEAVTLPRLIGALFALLLGPNLAVSAAILLAFCGCAPFKRTSSRSAWLSAERSVFYLWSRIYSLSCDIFNANSLSQVWWITSRTPSLALSSVGVVYLPSLWVADFFNSGSLVGVSCCFCWSSCLGGVISRFNDRINALVSEG